MFQNKNGFSILEVIIVITLGSMSLALALPNLTKMLDSFQFNSELASLKTQFAMLPLASIKAHAPVIIDNHSWREVVELADGYDMVLTKEILINRNGICSGGNFSLVSEHSTRMLVVSAPFCQIED